MMNDFPSISILVLNYNSMDHLPANLASLMALDYPADRLEIIVVDNASSDDSVAWVEANYLAVRVVPTGGNLGFAGGNNVGAEAAAGEWLAILNPDMRVATNWLRELVRPLSTDPTIAAVASKVLSWDGTHIDFADAAINFMGWGCQPGYRSKHLERYNEGKPLIFANGGAMLVRRQTFLDAGGFDPDYFAYYEDVDLGWRLWLQGHQVVFAPQAVAYHRHHGSWGEVADAKKWLLAERNTLLTLIKNYDDDALMHVLPAALLLVLQRAYLDICPDPALYGGGGIEAAKTAVYGPGYYWRQFRQMVQHREFAELWRRMWDEGGRRWEKRPFATAAAQTAPAYRRPVNGQYQAPPVAMARLLIAQDVLAMWDGLLQKRAQVQAGRRRADREIFPLFQWALISNFGDEVFIQAMNRVVQRFGLEAVFLTQRRSDADTRPGLETQALSLGVSRKLLELMRDLFIKSGAPASYFRLGQAGPPEMVATPERVVARLAEMNKLLWSLPQAPLPELLVWLEEQMKG